VRLERRQAAQQPHAATDRRRPMADSPTPWRRAARTDRGGPLRAGGSGAAGRALG